MRPSDVLLVVFAALLLASAWVIFFASKDDGLDRGGSWQDGACEGGRA